MKALLAYSFAEALGSLRRGWRATLLALLTTTAAVFVAASALLVSINLQEIFAKLGTASELTVYLQGTPTQAERDRIDALLSAAPAVQSRRFISPQEALRRFAADVPELAPLTNSLGENPFPPAFEVRLRPSANAAEGDAAAQALIKSLEATGVVEDVRYDRQVIDRLLAGLTTAQSAAGVLAGILVLAAVLTITSVLRLAYQTRQEEISILYLVGAPPRAIRGPFVAEGFIQALAGAVLALILVAAAFSTFRARYGQVVVDAFGLADVQFLPWTWIVLLLMVSSVLGALAGLGAAWRER
jgi:cell division transport system permease protein